MLFFVCPNYQTKCQTRLGAIMHLEYSISYHRVINILYNGIIMRNDAEKADTCRSPVFDNLQHYNKLKEIEKKNCLTVCSFSIFLFYVRP